MSVNKFKIWVKYALILGFVLFVDAVVYEPYALKITSYHLFNPQLSGLKIVFASDFHVARYKWEKWRLQRIVYAINAQNSDLVILGGDYINRHTNGGTMLPDDIVKALQQIKAPKVAVFGNHETYYGKYEVLRAFEKAKIPVLENRYIKLRLKNKKVYVAGVSDFDTGKPDIKKTLENVKSPLIFVTHSPDAMANLNGRADIAFAGHTHGGQVVLPFWGAPIVNISNKKYTYGLLYEHGKPLIISSGLSTSILPVRFNNLPEIVTVEFD